MLKSHIRIGRAHLPRVGTKNTKYVRGGGDVLPPSKPKQLTCGSIHYLILILA